MVAGHFGFAALVKSREKSAPLWALMLSTVWLDVVFLPLFIFHRETVQPVHAGDGGLLIHADYTHSYARAFMPSFTFGTVSPMHSGTTLTCRNLAKPTTSLPNSLFVTWEPNLLFCAKNDDP